MIVNSYTDIVPFGKYEGLSFEELAETNLHYAHWMLKESDLRSKYPDHYWDLEFVLLGKPIAHTNWNHFNRHPWKR